MDASRLKRLFLIADCEGALTLVQQALLAGGIIDVGGSWGAPRGTLLVFLGDTIDRGSQGIALQRALISWSDQAANQGSELAVIWGNHELMALGAAIGEKDTTSVWLTNGGTEILREALDEGITIRHPRLQELGSDRSTLLTTLGSSVAAYLWGGLDNGRLIDGELSAIVNQSHPFMRVGDLLFVHGGVSDWLVDAALNCGGFEEARIRLESDIADPLTRGKDALTRSFMRGVGKKLGGDLAPDQTSPAWLSFDSEQTAALRSRRLDAFLANEGIRYVFCGHSPALRPRQISNGNTQVFCLDSRLRTEKRGRPHLFEWEIKLRQLRWYADNSVLRG